jgi:regulator of chromosome condensation
MSNISLGDNDHTTSHLMTSNQQHVLSLLTSGEIGSGHYHSFAIHKSGDIYAWGLNDYEQTTMSQHARFEREMFPKKLHMLKRNSDNPRETQESFRYKAGNITATLSTKKGYCHSWGRIDKHGIGVDRQRLALIVGDIAIIRDQNGRGRVWKVPVQAEVIFGATSLGVGTDHFDRHHSNWRRLQLGYE